ncbi:MAG: DUF3857 domain-containing protein [Deltaproteobacteria bacterium]|nr:DUF3857 domain-containing protein [Deltaproteobacteria bacterium]
MRVGRNILIFLSLFILSCTATNSNIKSISDGDVNLFLKQTPKAEEYPNAGADLLYSYDYIEFYADGTSVSRNLNRIKIFNERGRNFASNSISYREGYQEVKILFANTIKPDGKIVSLDSNDIHDSSEYAGYEFYTDIKVKRFTMPAVEDGCIIEYAYEIKNLKPFLSFDYFNIFFCQNFFPIEEDIMEIVLPADIELKYKKFKTTLTPQIISAGNKKRYIFTNTRQKEIIPESRIPSLYDKDVFPQLSFWTLNNWDVISNWYVKLIKEQMKSDSELDNFTKQLVAGKKTEEEKINAIFNFISQNIRYIAVLLGPHTHKPHLAYEIFQKRYGDCKDKTVLLLTMLKIAGIEGKPALVPAYGKYFDDSMPSLNAFNHVIAVVPSGGKYFWLDATNETAAYNSVPFLIPTKVFLINDDGSYTFIKTPELDSKKDYYTVDAKYNIDREGNATIDNTHAYFGKAAESIRYSFKYSPPEQRKKLFEERGFEVKDLNLSSFTETQEPFIIKFSGNFKNLAQKLDEDIMVLSNIVSLDSYKDITAASNRKYPISLKQSFYSRENYSYKFPSGFKIKKLPKDYTFDKPFKYRTEKYSFKKSIFNMNMESKNMEQTIGLENIDDFKNNAVELQKHESSVKNIIFEKK